MAIPLARWFYEIEPIPVEDVVALGLDSLTRALVVVAARRLDLLGHLEAHVTGRESA